MGHLRAVAANKINKRKSDRWISNWKCVPDCVWAHIFQHSRNCQTANRQFFFINICVLFLLSDFGLCRCRTRDSSILCNLLLAALTLPNLYRAVHLTARRERTSWDVRMCGKRRQRCRWRRRDDTANEERERERMRWTPRAASNMPEKTKQKSKKETFFFFF